MEKDIAFLEKVQNLFLEHGAKTLTMDDIARELGMSKKTLYQKYKNKEAMLEEVLAFGTSKVLERLKNLEDTIDNAIDRMFLRDELIEKASSTNKSILLKQLTKYYPQIFNRHMINFSEKFADLLVHNTERGRRQGYYREDFDPYFYAKLYFQTVMSYDNSPFLDTTRIGRQEYQKEALRFYMNAITTEKGKEYMRSIGE